MNPAPHSTDPENSLFTTFFSTSSALVNHFSSKNPRINHPGGVYSAGTTKKGNPTATRSAKRDETRRRRSPATSTFQTSRSSSFICTIDGVFFYWRRQLLDFAFSEWLFVYACLFVALGNQNPSYPFRDRLRVASSRAFFPTTIADIIQFCIGVAPAYLLIYCCIC